MSADCIVTVFATRNRRSEVERLVESLATQKKEIHAIVIVDNGSDPVLEERARSWRWPVTYLAPATNLGVGAALRLAEEAALRDYPTLTHILIVDDDVVLNPDSLGSLVAAARERAAWGAAPLITDSAGRLGWRSGVRDQSLEQKLLKCATASDVLQHIGPTPWELVWTQGICLLVTRECLRAVGYHAEDFWVRGEDFDYSLRISARRRLIQVPTAVVRHIMPPPSATPEGIALEYRKQCAMVQNVAYLALHTPHGKILRPKLAGRFWRHFLNWGISPRTIRDALRLAWRGLIMGRPAGHSSYLWPKHSEP